MPTRRQFLGSTAGLAAAWLAGACKPDAAVSAPAEPFPDAFVAADLPAVETSPTADFAALRKALAGSLLLPADAGFAEAARTFQTRFDAVHPRAIAQCAHAADVQTCVRWAQANHVPVRIRAGGHSYAGYCTDAAALVIDVRALAAVALDTTLNRLTVGGGALIVDTQAALWANNLALSTGSCPTVGMAGLTLGGGFGLIARQLGLTCDALLSVDMVLASGDLVTCSDTQSADLFWACRGGGGGNFGVVTALTYQVVPIAAATAFSLQWPWSQAAQVVKAWQQWAPGAADALTAECQLFAGGNGGAPPTIAVGGGFLGTSAQLKPLLDQLYALGAGPPASQDMQTGTYGQIAPMWLDCDGVVAHCHLKGRSPQGQVERETYVAKSDYMTVLLPDAAMPLLIAALEARASSPFMGGIQFGPYGGAIAKVAPTATAFVHRNALFVCQYLAFGQDGGSLAADKTWLDSAYQGMRPFVSGQAYQNYVDPALVDWRAAYYGQNLNQLQAVKAKYDPTRFFDFAQAI